MAKTTTKPTREQALQAMLERIDECAPSPTMQWLQVRAERTLAADREKADAKK